MSNRTVVVTDHDFETLDIERTVLDDLADVVELSDTNDTPADDEALIAADGVLNLRRKLDAKTIAEMNNCQIIARYGIGVDNVDLDAATANDILVTNVPEYCVEEVSTHTLSLLLALARGLKRYDASVTEGNWARERAAPLHRLSMQTVGIVGFGAIGRSVGNKAAALGMDVIASDPFLTSSDLIDSPATLVEFETLLAEADYVTIHSPLTTETQGLFDTAVFERMKPSAALINVARGPIIDHDALHKAIEADEIRGAGLDVFEDEPPALDNSLRNHEQVLTTPHVAWYSEEANDERRRTAARNVRALFMSETPPNVIDD